MTVLGWYLIMSLLNISKKPFHPVVSMCIGVILLKDLADNITNSYSSKVSWQQGYSYGLCTFLCFFKFCISCLLKASKHSQQMSEAVASIRSSYSVKLSRCYISKLHIYISTASVKTVTISVN